MEGKTATLKKPYRGLNSVLIRVIKKLQYKYQCQVEGSGETLFLYEDEFELIND